MPELLVPGQACDPFREHYRELIVSSLLRSAREQSTLHREQHRMRRAARYDRAVVLLAGEDAAALAAPAPPPPLPPVAAPAPAAPAPIDEVDLLAQPVIPVPEPSTPPVTATGEASLGPMFRGAAGTVWCLTLAMLAADILVFGLHSWATGIADLGLIALTVVWFLAISEDAGRTRGSSSAADAR